MGDALFGEFAEITIGSFARIGEVSFSVLIFLPAVLFTAAVDCGFCEICAFTRALTSANLFASNAGLGKLICPGKFSLFLFLLISLFDD
jgi:hypothetical protein